MYNNNDDNNDNTDDNYELDNDCIKMIQFDEKSEMEYRIWKQVS